ncbi:MAG: apolipoprotein D and lipocalin family protein [Flavobacterium sp.]|jgi:apolipoprotein D and lipocalin family protein
MVLYMNQFRLFFLVALLAGCASTSYPPLTTAEAVDLDRFAGDWYVIASIPTFLEKDAYNAIESYAPPENGVIKTTFSFNEGGLDGEEKRYHPTGFVDQSDESNALWRMQFVWPFKAEYRIVYVSEDYDLTIIGRSKRDYVWIMARTPLLAEQSYQSLINIVQREGYDLSALRKVPHDKLK